MLNKTVATIIQAIKSDYSLAKTHKKGCQQAREYHDRPSLKLHLACGHVYKTGWVNIDLAPGVADICLDLRQRLPFPDNSCDEVYSEHFLEHLAYPGEALKFLSELLRVIKPRGSVTTSVPDTEWPLRSYSEGAHAEYFRIAKEKYHPADCTTSMEHINYHFRQGGEHLFAYDGETLLHILKRAGFRHNLPRQFDPSIDSASRHPGSLYVVSRKE